MTEQLVRSVCANCHGIFLGELEKCPKCNGTIELVRIAVEHVNKTRPKWADFTFVAWLAENCTSCPPNGQRQVFTMDLHAAQLGAQRVQEFARRFYGGLDVPAEESLKMYSLAITMNACERVAFDKTLHACCAAWVRFLSAKRFAVN